MFNQRESNISEHKGFFVYMLVVLIFFLFSPLSNAALTDFLSPSDAWAVEAQDIFESTDLPIYVQIDMDQKEITLSNQAYVPVDLNILALDGEGFEIARYFLPAFSDPAGLTLTFNYIFGTTSVDRIASVKVVSNEPIRVVEIGLNEFHDLELKTRQSVSLVSLALTRDITVPLSVPFSSQRNDSWGCTQLGTTSSVCSGNSKCGGQGSGNYIEPYLTIWNYGCFLTSKTMLFNYFRPSYYDPSSLNSCLKTLGGYDSGCLMKFDDTCSPITTGIVVRHIYSSSNSNLATLSPLIDQYLGMGYPILADVRYNTAESCDTKGSQHMVVIVAKNGTTYTIKDPWDGTEVSRTLNNGAISGGAYKLCRIHVYEGPVPGTTCSDFGEPNDSFNAAYSVSCGSTNTAKICSSTDVDDYKVTPSSSGTMTITLTPPSDKDYDIYFYNASQQMMTGCSFNGTGVQDKCTVPVTAGQTYYIKVVGYVNAYSTTSNYSLGVTCPSASSCISTVSSTQWKGEYFNNKTLSGSPSMVRDDGSSGLNFNWGTGGPSSSCGIGVDNFSTRWTRTVNFSSGTYRFTVTSDDGFRLYVDGVLKLDKWFGQATTTYTVDVPLTAGNHVIKMEYFELGGGATAKLSWQVTGATGAVSGKLHIGSASGTPLSGATVSCGGKTTTTDINGFYILSGITPGNQTVSFSKTGYQPFSKAVSIIANLCITAGDNWLAPNSCLSTVSSTQWKGEYFNNKTLSGSPSMVRDDGSAGLNFSWGTGGPSTSCGIGVDNFSTRWTRTVNFSSGNYRFTVTSDDGFRLYVDGVLKLDKWFGQATTTYTVDVPLTAGNHVIKMEYFELGGGATAKLSWQNMSNNAPIAEAAVSKSLTGPYYGYSTPLTVTKGQSVTLYFFADKDVNGDAKASLDPDGWTNADNGVSSGGKCEWNTDLNQGTPTFEIGGTTFSPLSAGACNRGPYTYTFNDVPGTYEYQMLRVTDRKGAQSIVSRIKVTVVNPVTYTMSGTIHSGSNTGPVVSGATVSIAGKTATTSSTGTFTIPGISAGTYAFTVSKSGYTTYTNPAYYIGSNQSGLNFYLTLPTPIYEGWIDATDCDSIRGWAWDKNQPNTSINVDIYNGSTKLTTMTAGTFRQDLVNAGKGNGYHGFSYATPSSLKDGNARSIYVKYAGTSTNLSGSPKTLTCSGYASVSQGVSISSNPVKLGQNFTISFTLKERRGAAKTFENIAVAILDPSGTFVFDFVMFPAVTIPAYGTKSYSAQNYIYTSRPTGTYKAVVRGKVGGVWFDFDTVDSGVTPKSFSVVR